MSEEMKRVGSIFKAKRKEMNLSLKEIENGISIRTGHLEAIEEGRAAEVLSGVYTIGFIKQYASFLGLDLEAIARDNPQAFRLPAEKHEFEYGIGTLEVRGTMGGGVKWLPNLIWAALSAAVIFLAWYFAKSLGIL